MSEYQPGIGCRCCAHSENECCCPNVDWRSTREVELEAFVEKLTKERNALKTVPMKYRRMQFNAELQDEVTQLQKQLAALAERIKELETEFAGCSELLNNADRIIERQSAALKLAREALFDMQDSYAAVHGWKDSFVIAATTAIAAIDSLQKGE